MNLVIASVPKHELRHICLVQVTICLKNVIKGKALTQYCMTGKPDFALSV